MLKAYGRVALGSLVVFGLLTTTAWAIKRNVEILAPGVDAAGNLDPQLGTQMVVKANINLRSNTFTAKGKGKVQNLSGQNQTFNNVPVSIDGATVQSSVYTVRSNGNANVTARGTVERD